MNQKIDKERAAFISRMRDLMKLRHAREFVWEVLSLAQLYTYNVNEGRRALGIDLLALLEDVDPTLYPRMILENIKEDSNGRRIDDTDDTDGTDE